jgi:hypothetical protein
MPSRTRWRTSATCDRSRHRRMHLERRAGGIEHARVHVRQPRESRGGSNLQHPCSDAAAARHPLRTRYGRTGCGDNGCMQANPRLQALDALVGEWTTDGAHPMLPGLTLHGRGGRRASRRRIPSRSNGGLTQVQPSCFLRVSADGRPSSGRSRARAGRAGPRQRSTSAGGRIVSKPWSSSKNGA